MTAAQTRDRLASLLVEPLAAVGLDLEDVDLSSAGRRRVLRIAVDRDGGVSLDDVADATREVSKVLDDSEVMGEQPYTLEVTSPGVDRPLTRPRHWRRNHDRLVEVRLADGARLTGRIAASDDAAATLDVDGEEPQVAARRRRAGPGPDRVQAEGRLTPVDIDMNILRMLEREKEISFEVLVEAIEQALLTAYHRTPGATEQARVELDRKTGHVTVFAAETDDEGNVVAEYDDTPEGFGRIAATTAKQIMLQRLRDAEDELRFGEFSGKEGDIISGVIQQGRNPDDVMVDLGKLEATAAAGGAGAGGGLRARHPDQVPGGLGPQGHARAADHAVAHPPQPGQEAVRARGPRDRRRHRRDRRDRPRGRPPHQDRGAHAESRRQRQGCLHRPDGPAGPQRDVRAARREDRHRRLLRRPGRVRRRTRCRPARVSVGESWSTRAARAARVVVPDFQLSLAIGKEGQNARLAARLTGWRIDIRSDEAPAA